MTHSSSKHALSIFTLAMINVAAIVSLKNLPMLSKVGIWIIPLYLIVALVFFIPCALVSAELSTGWPSKGGVYTWVKTALGARAGFVAIWMLWMENVIWYPTIVSFAAATLAYTISPELANNKYYMIVSVLTIFWGSTFVNFFGMRASGLISTLGVILGTLIPGALIMLLGALWLCNHPTHFFTAVAMPNLTNAGTLAFLIGLFFSLTGMEMSAVHTTEIKHPEKNYPRAILISVLLILFLSIFGVLAISMVVPADQMNLTTGVMQAFEKFFLAYHLPFMTKIVALLISLGAIGMVSTWIIGPSKGLLETAHHGDIPKLFRKTNRFGKPVTIMLMQAILLTLLMLVFLFMPSVNSSYWILTDLAAQVYLIMYGLMFLASLRLRYSHPRTPRAYKIPFGNIGIWIVSLLGLGSCVFAFVMGFLPPSGIDMESVSLHYWFLSIGLIIMIALPLVIYAYCHRDENGEPS